MTTQNDFPYGYEGFRPDNDTEHRPFPDTQDFFGGDIPLPDEHVSESSSSEITPAHLRNTIENGFELLEGTIPSLLERGSRAYGDLVAKITEGTPDERERQHRLGVFDTFNEMTKTIGSLHASLAGMREKMTSLLDDELEHDDMKVLSELDIRYRKIFREYGEQLIAYENIIDGLERFNNVLSQ
jgi:hypothetical protein